MKNTLITLSATALLAMGSVAIADETQGPVMLTDAQMDQMVAGRACVGCDSLRTSGTGPIQEGYVLADPNADAADTRTLMGDAKSHNNRAANISD